MGIKDLVVTPVILLLVYAFAYILRPKFTDNVTRKYFIPGLSLKIIGALAVGIIYQFYYKGGDTFNFYNDSLKIWEAFQDSPRKAFQLIFLTDGEYISDTYNYSSRMIFYKDNASFMVVRIISMLGFLTFQTYSAIAVLFAALSFIGVWSLYRVFYVLNPALHKQIAIATLFIPTVFFWGSGIFKDTVTFGCLGILTYSLYNMLIAKKKVLINGFLLVIAFWLIYKIKVYILLSFLPATVIWIVSKNLGLIKSPLVKYTVMPLIVLIAFFISYNGIVAVSEYDPRYSFERIAETARTTAYDIAFKTGRDAGSTYVLGEIDGTFSGLLPLAPQAINASLFRPYIWEVKNPLMALSALEALFFLFLTLRVTFTKGFFRVFRFLLKPDVLFCLVFAITFAFAAGVATFNFGSLSRYKIPMIPFYVMGLFIIQHHIKAIKLDRMKKASGFNYPRLKVK